MPVVDEFASQGRVVKVEAVKSPDEVYEETKEKLKERGLVPNKQ